MNLARGQVPCLRLAASGDVAARDSGLSLFMKK